MKVVLEREEIFNILSNHIAIKYLNLPHGAVITCKGKWEADRDTLVVCLEVEEKK